MSFQDTLKRIQEQNALNNITINNPPVITVDEDNNNSNESSLGSLLSAFGIGASNMVNNTVLGGVLGQFPGFLGSYVEKFSPFSGEQNEDVLRLVKMGFPLKEAREIYPYRDSWLTSLGKSSLALNNYIGDYIQDWRNNTLGDNPTFAEQAMEGAGSSLGFMGTGLLTALGTGNPFLGAIASGATEALSESGGTLADAYRQGMYNQGLEAADKSFAANLALNSVLNAFLGPFNSKTAGIRNPVTRHLRGTAEQVLNEIIQEPSQKVIENAAAESMHNGGEFVSALGGQIPQWGDYFSELAPSVTASTLITQGLLGLGGMATPNIRQSWARQYVHRNEDTQQAETRLQEHYDAIERLNKRLEREKSGNNNQAVIDSLKSRIEKRMRQIQNITDAFRLYDFMPSPETVNNDDYTADVALDNNQSARTRYKLVELDSIATPENLKSDNETVSNITENFDPAAFGANESYNLGAPVISPQEGIEYGNERLDALRQIYTSDPEKTSRYRNWLVDNADSFGYDSREVQHMKYPVLVRQRISEIQNNNQPSASQNAGQGNAQNTENETLPPKKGTRKRNKNPDDKTLPLLPDTEVQRENNSENQANTNPTENTPTVSETESNTHNPQMDMNTTETQRLNSLNNEAFYGNDEFYSDSGGDNSAQYQDIPETHTPDTLKDMPSITAIRNRPNIGNPGTSRFMPEVQMPQSVRFMPDIQKPAVSRNIDSTRNILTPANNNPLAEPQQNPNADITFDEALGKVAEIIYKSYSKSPNTLHPIQEIWAYTRTLPQDLSQKIDNYLNEKHIIKGFFSGNWDEAAYTVNNLDALMDILPKNAPIQETAPESSTPAQTNTLPKTYKPGKVRLQPLGNDNPDAVAEQNLDILRRTPTDYERKKLLNAQSMTTDDLKRMREYIMRKYNRRMGDQEKRSDTIDSILIFINQTSSHPYSPQPEYNDKYPANLPRAIVRAGTYENIVSTLMHFPYQQVKNFALAIGGYNTYSDKQIVIANLASGFSSRISNLKKGYGLDDVEHPIVRAFKETKETLKADTKPDTQENTAQQEQKQPENNTQGTQEDYPTIEQNSFNQDSLQNTQNAPNDNSALKHNNNYDGFIGFLDVNQHNGESHSVNIFLDDYNGKPYLDFTDENGDSVAVFDINSNSFTIRPEHLTTGWIRNIEGDFRRNFGKNYTEEILRRSFRQKAIDAGVNEQNADATATVYIAGNKFFAKYSGQSLFNTVKSDNISIQKSENQQNNNSRGETTFVEQKKDDNGNVIQEAQSIVKLFQNADKSTLLHEIGHIFLNKLKNLARAGLLRNNKGKLNNAGIDWGIIMREYGLKDIDFSKELSGKDLELWHNAQENFASSLEKYFWKGQAPQSFSQRIKHVFKAFKSWLQNIYHSLSDIKYTDAKGKQHAFSLSKDIKAVFDDLLADDSNLTSQAVQNSNQRENTAAITENITDREILPSKINDKTKNTDNIPAVSENRNQTENNSNQRTNDRGGFFSWLKRIGNHVMHPLYSIAHVPTITDGRDFAIPNPESNRRFLEAMNTPSTATRLGVFGRINQFMHDTAKAIRGGDYSDITNSPRKNDPQLKLLDALHALRKLGRDKITAADKAVSEMTDIIKTLNPKQRQLLNYYTVFRDLLFQIEDMPGSDLGFHLTEKDVRDMNKKLTPMVLEDHTIYDAVKKLDDSMRKQNEEFMRLARLLGKNVDGLFRNPHYFRHRIINYMQAARTRTLPAPAKGNLDIQNRFDAEFRQIMGRDFFKKRKGSEFDFITDYVMANAEVRAQLAQDIETMKTLLQIKKMHDIAPTLRKKFGDGDNSQQGQNLDGSQTFSQSGETQHSAWLDHLPDGMTALDPSVIGLIESDKSAHDNILDMAVREISDKFGIPLDRLVEQGLTVEDNIMVIPTEIAETLRKMAKSRHRGMLGQAAKDFTTWWKRAVLFTPTRNLLYNIRNFTGDIDALIAGNPHALKHFPRAVKELAGYFLHRGKKDYEASQDLKDYIRLSGNLGIQSLNLSARDAQAMIDLIPTPEKTKSGKTFPKRAEKEAARLQRAEQRAQDTLESRELTQKFSKIKNALGVPMEWVQKFFSLEHGFTEMREHLLRFACYLDYKQQMETNKDGRPSNWGASIEEEVMSVKDIKERAFKMSNELLGAYDQISEVGKQLRDMLIPFYSWMEVNMRRTYRLLRNGFKYGKGMQAVQGYLKGKAYTIPLYAVPAAWSVAKLMMFTGAIQLFNRMWAPDADDDLPNDVKYRPHITLGKHNGRVYYFDRIGAIADALDWFSLDSLFLDAKDLANGQQSIGGYMKKIMQAPFSKVINGLNPAIKMPFELTMGRSMFPNAFNPSTIRDPAEYIARSFGMAWPYKAITGKPHNNLQELSHLIVYSQDTDEAAYWQTLDRVRQFQNQVLDKHFDGFASTARGRILQNIKKALRYNDREALSRYLREYTQADGTKQGLKQSMKAMHPLHGLSEKEKAQFLKWISPDDRKFLRKAERYFHHLADRFIR